MALQGTIDTFDLAEVISMLAAGGKNGRLGLSGSSGSGSLWFAGGRIVASETDCTDLATDHAAVLFQLLRFDEGSFVFEQGAEADESGEPTEAEDVLTEAQNRLADWREIEAVVPSLAHRVTLVAELSPSEVVIDQGRWRAIALVDGGTTVAGLGHVLEQDEVEVSRLVKDLVELGVFELDEPEEEAEPAAAENRTDFDAIELATSITADGPSFEPIPVESTPLEDVDPGFDPDAVPVAGEEVGDATGMEGPDLVVAEAGLEVDSGARDQLDALASGFGLLDEEAAVPAEPIEEDQPVEADQLVPDPGSPDPDAPAPLLGAEEDRGPSFPIEEAEAAGEARVPLFAHDDDGVGAPATAATPMPQPGEAAEVARQLANLSPEAARAVAAAARATTDEEREAALAEVAEDGDEPLDPDLLRSFLASVRE